MNIYDYTEAEFRTFALWGVDSEGHCECGDPDCEAILKHPRVSSWQHSPVWSDEQLEIMEESGQLKTGFGVCLDGHLVIDIDPRNGGNEAYEQLKADTGIDYEQASGFVVATGGGGRHIYFKHDAKNALATKLKQYEGIDFKNSGYVVGCGSLHASGLTYDASKGSPQDLTEAPDELLELLRKPEKVRASLADGCHVDISDADIASMLNCVDPDCDYDSWVNIGMAIHDATAGNGFDLWLDWSKDGEKFSGVSKLDRHWQSFGKCANPVTIGTLIHHAEQGGWKMPVTFTVEAQALGEAGRAISVKESHEDHPVDPSGVDCRRPPGFVGKLTKWINQNSVRPRENLAAIAALAAISTIGSLRYKDDKTGVTPNLFTLLVAGSGSGKNAIEESYVEIINASGMGKALYGTIKSDTEIIRNLVRHQGAFYQIGEIAHFLKKVSVGGANSAYLIGVLSTLMDLYSKSNGVYTLGGDVKEEARQKITAVVGALETAINENKFGKDEGKREAAQRELDDLKAAISQMDNGLKNPCITLVGATTPVMFDSLVDFEQATNGFFGRCIIGREADTAPRRKKDFEGKVALPDMMAAKLKSIHSVGTADFNEGRLQHIGERVAIPSTAEALDALELIADWAEDLAIWHSKNTGLEALPNRAYEMIAKVSLVLAIPEGQRTIQHVVWAYKLIRNDIDTKVRLAQNTMLDGSKILDDRKTVLTNKIIERCKDSDGASLSHIVRAAGRKFQKADIEMVLNDLVEENKIEQLEMEGGNGRKIIRYKTL